MKAHLEGLGYDNSTVQDTKCGKRTFAKLWSPCVLYKSIMM
jgi:hypothetical protein